MYVYVCIYDILYIIYVHIRVLVKKIYTYIHRCMVCDTVNYVQFRSCSVSILKKICVGFKNGTNGPTEMGDFQHV